MHLGQRLALLDGVTALGEADDADRVVDRVLLRPPAGAEMQGGVADRDRAEPADEPRRRRRHVAHDRRRRQRALVRRAALRLDPATPRGVGRAVGDGRLGAAPPFGVVDPEVGQREQARARVEHELA